MQEKNAKLAKENNDLKGIISQKARLQEDILKRSIQDQYKQILSYKEMLKSIEESISAMEDALERCRRIKETVVSNRRLLADTTNQNKGRDGGKENKENEKRPQTTGTFSSVEEISEYGGTVRTKGKGSAVERDLFDKWG